MYEFKRFLFQTEGERLHLFWMDVEHLKCHQSQFYVRKLIIRITRTYIAEGSPFMLSNSLREGLVAVQKSDEPQNRWHTNQQVKELVQCQTRALETLREYWCQRYALKHRDERFGSKELFLSKKPHPSSSRACSVDKLMRRSARQSSYRPESLPLVESGESVAAREGTRRASHIKISTSKIPFLYSGEKNVVTQAVSNDTLAKSTILARSEPNTLLSSSAYSLISRSSSSLLQKELTLEMSDDVQLESFLCAALRADFTAGNPFLRYLKEVKSNPACVSYLLFWQSVENILTQDEMRRWYTMWRLVNKEEVDDTPTSVPYLSYFEPYLVAKNPQELCLFFLQSRSLHKVDLPDDVTEGLALLVPKGLGQGLLLAAQEYAIKVSLKALHALYLSPCDRRTLWNLGRNTCI